MTVSQLARMLSLLSHLDEDEIYQYSRKLIDAGILPKARGRAIPEVQFDQIAALLVSVFAIEKASEAPQACQTYGIDLKNKEGVSLREWIAHDLSDSGGRVKHLKRFVLCRSQPRAEMHYRYEDDSAERVVIFETDPPAQGHPTKVEVTVKGYVFQMLAIGTEPADWKSGMTATGGDSDG